MDEKRNKGLCFHYDDKWHPRHHYKGSKVYLIQMEEDLIQIHLSKDHIQVHDEEKVE